MQKSSSMPWWQKLLMGVGPTALGLGIGAIGGDMLAGAAGGAEAGARIAEDASQRRDQLERESRARQEHFEERKHLEDEAHRVRQEQNEWEHKEKKAQWDREQRADAAKVTAMNAHEDKNRGSLSAFQTKTLAQQQADSEARAKEAGASHAETVRFHTGESAAREREDKAAKLRQDLDRLLPIRDEYGQPKQYTAGQITEAKNSLQESEGNAAPSHFNFGGGLPAPPSPGGPVRVSSPDEAMKLPSGTRFITPDGQVRVKH